MPYVFQHGKLIIYIREVLHIIQLHVIRTRVASLVFLSVRVMDKLRIVLYFLTASQIAHVQVINFLATTKSIGIPMIATDFWINS